MNAYSVIQPKNDANDLSSCMYYYIENVNLGLIYSPNMDIYELCFNNNLTKLETNRLKEYFKIN